MKNSEFITHFANAADKMVEICKLKNSDYADGDSFSNFKMNEILNVCSCEQAIFSRMLDKVTRVANLMKKEPSVKEEAIEDTLIDLANYSIILAIYLKNKK